MSQSGDLFDPSLRELCPRVCVQCDYALEGLPVGVICPECGLVEDPTILTIRGWEQPPLATQSRWNKGWAIFAAAMSPMYLYFIAWNGFSDRIFFLLLLGANLFPVLYPRAIAFLNNVQGPLMRLRLCAAGFEHRIGAGPLKLQRWEPGLLPHSKLFGPNLWSVWTTWGGEVAFRRSRRFFRFYFHATPEQSAAVVREMTGWIRKSQPARLSDSLPWRSGRVVRQVAQKIASDPAKID